MLVLSTLIPLAGTPVVARGDEPSELRIGYQKASVNLLLARQLGLVERQFPHTRVQWAEFAAGPPLLEALGARGLDFGMTGDTPPIFAQVAGRDILYVGVEPSKPFSSAILVAPQSDITFLSGLRGKRVAFTKGSSAHYLILRALAKAGLKYSDIQPIYLAPADARAAFENRSVDAWVIWDPYWAAAEHSTQVRVLATGEGLSDNNTFYQSTREFASKYPQAIQTLLRVLTQADQYLQSHKSEASALIATATGLSPEAASTYLSRRAASPVQTLGPAAIAEQQIVADAFFNAALIPHSINIADAVWQPDPVTTVRSR
jgi:sulfonate transport system substrate-binding protein